MRWIILVVTLWASPAAADVMGPCPEGQIVVHNPGSAESRHHGGFHCEDDPNASHCSASPRRAGAGSASLAALVALAALARRRSR